MYFLSKMGISIAMLVYWRVNVLNLSIQVARSQHTKRGPLLVRSPLIFDGQIPETPNNQFFLWLFQLDDEPNQYVHKKRLFHQTSTTKKVVV